MIKSWEYSLAELPQVANRLLVELAAYKIWLFEGDMGAGKTTLIKALCHELGVQDKVQSPTFSLVNEYRTADGKPLYHFDCYRLKNPYEALDFGLEEYFDSGHWCWVEWPSKITPLLPTDAVTLHLSELPDGRRQIAVSLTD